MIVHVQGPLTTWECPMGWRKESRMWDDGTTFMLLGEIWPGYSRPWMRLMDPGGKIWQAPVEDVRKHTRRYTRA